MNKKPKYTNEFRERAVRLSLDDDTTVEQVAEELGISKSSLSRWREKMGVSAIRGEGKRPPRQEIEELQRQLKQAEKEKRALAMEVEILKKAAAFFARHQA